MDYSPTSVAIREALERILPVFVSILLRCGVTYSELDNRLRRIFVATATWQFGIRGRPTNVSRTAVLTGISRHQVRKIRDLSAEDATACSVRVMGVFAEVLSNWHCDERYCDRSGKPRGIWFSSENGVSFENLVASIRRDIPATSILRELKRVGAVSEGADGRLHVHAIDYTPAGSTPEQFNRFGEVVRDFLSSTGHNALAEPTDRLRRECRSTVEIPQRHMEQANQVIRDNANKFLKSVDRELTKLSARGHEREETGCYRVGVGIYQIEEPLGRVEPDS